MPLSGLTSTLWDELAQKAIEKVPPTPEEALSILKAPQEETLSLVDAAYRVRRHFHGNKVRIHVLQNAKSGACPEDCGFCSQSSKYQTPASTYPMLDVEELVEGARKAKSAGAWKYCMVTATRGPSNRDLDVICEATRRIKSEGGIKVCTSLGILTPEKARRLAEAGVDRFNHNLETSERHYAKIVSTHSYQDRVATTQYAREAGMEICSGGIIGLGEETEDILELCYALRRVGATSVPVNFLDPRPGTPLGGGTPVDPYYALRVLCFFRFVHPDVDLRAAGGREITFRSLQPLVLYVVNSIFTNGYLTTGGQGENADHRMIQDMGMVPEVVGGEFNAG
ncbi:MAG TPA: biotin synthase BioB [bacterium]|nr:biotin synthase BioB [bacterium]